MGNSIAVFWLAGETCLADILETVLPVVPPDFSAEPEAGPALAIAGPGRLAAATIAAFSAIWPAVRLPVSAPCVGIGPAEVTDPGVSPDGGVVARCRFAGCAGVMVGTGL
jgi:hypothetical protein